MKHKILTKNYHFDALMLSGTLAAQKKQYPEALELLTKALLIDDRNANVYLNRGVVLNELHFKNEALASYDMAIKLNPSYSNAYYNRGIVQQELKRLDQALQNYDLAIKFNCNYAEAYNNRGNVLSSLNLLDSAIESYDMAIKINSSYADAYINRGNALHILKRFDDAIKSYDMAILINPTNSDAWYYRGNCFLELNFAQEALASYEKTHQLKPDYENLLGSIQLAKMYSCNWNNLPEVFSQIESGITNSKKVSTPFTPLICFDKPELHLQSSKIWSNIRFPQNQKLGYLAKQINGGKLRLGYFSADLYFSPVSIWLVEQIENHDKTKFELFAFSLKSDVKDPMRARLQGSFDHFIEVDRKSDEEIALLARQLGIDIALDLNGYTKNSRTGIFAFRAAPIQVSHLGFPGTLGNEYTDYFLTDIHSVPENSKQYFTEKIAYVPCVYTYDKNRQLCTEPISRTDYGLPLNGFVFCCQNGAHKFNPEVFDIWMGILKAVPNSVLWLQKPNLSAENNLILEAQKRGISNERLIFTARGTTPKHMESVRISRYLASYQLADLFLDTWPYNSGTTAVDALWAGLPVLTKLGKSCVARMAASALQAIEVTDLITNTPDEYKDLAIELAVNVTKLEVIKNKLLKNKMATKLFDSACNTKHIEDAYIKMFEIYQLGLNPDHIYIR
jgi:predicted O-linked N-acetylglucosamine transferase (SPINDLY family)